MKNLTVRLSEELHQQLAEYAKQKDMSINRAVKTAIRLLLKQGQED